MGRERERERERDCKRVKRIRGVTVIDRDNEINEEEIKRVKEMNSKLIERDS